MEWAGWMFLIKSKAMSTDFFYPVILPTLFCWTNSNIINYIAQQINKSNQMA